MNRMKGSGFALLLALCAMTVGCVTHVHHYTPAGPVAPSAPPVDSAENEPFYDDLAPHGSWVQVEGPGWVWRPGGVTAAWRPYHLGHWVFTDHGWTWASDEQWGWAVYHYGRWHRDVRYGWVWAPGTEWGAAWVAWHEGGGHVGWAPLPWQARWRAGVGLDWGGADVRVAIGSDWWSFVAVGHLVDRDVRRRILPPAKNVSLMRITRNVTNYNYIDNRIVNQSVKIETVSKAVGRAVPRYRLVAREAADAARGGRIDGDDFVMFRPDATRGRKPRPRGESASERGADPPRAVPIPRTPSWAEKVEKMRRGESSRDAQRGGHGRDRGKSDEAPPVRQEEGPAPGVPAAEQPPRDRRDHPGTAPGSKRDEAPGHGAGAEAAPGRAKPAPPAGPAHDAPGAPETGDRGRGADRPTPPAAGPSTPAVSDPPAKGKPERAKAAVPKGRKPSKGAAPNGKPASAADEGDAESGKPDADGAEEKKEGGSR